MRKPNSGATRRSAARLAAVQALYSMEITGVSAEQALDEFRQRLESEPRGKLADPDGDLVSLLVRGATAEGAELDRQIAAGLARDWTVDRLESVLRAILRAGAFELKSRPQTPARVAITEYVDVAHAFYSGPEPGLVNAVMDRMARNLRPAEFEGGGAPAP
ncbi:transcription antitermination factor NusB [Magnetospirillum sulfuroxidans]|uniref:Transcription antitermination protein NusB n=1 Tax=Magnetospirillum sulfuroxidans TaxID=611300 RepID=A0ABS5IA66_9PROT|nr:transcription antitermination factor NusB [Magnetospirillum sulfuroxidans]MBR9970593.1 transcription antitermination factor NusB [Magnetospirillum sulfuroxidans]